MGNRLQGNFNFDEKRRVELSQPTKAQLAFMRLQEIRHAPADGSFIMSAAGVMKLAVANHYWLVQRTGDTTMHYESANLDHIPMKFASPVLT